MKALVLTLPLTLALLAVAACDDANVIRPDPGLDQCQAPAYRSLVGRPVAALNGVLFAVPYRVIRPGDAVTEEFMPTRINISLDGGDRIVAVACD